MDKIFEELNVHELLRTDLGVFTLGDEGLDKTFCLDQSIATLTPTKHSIEGFAAVSFMFGVLGYQVSEFSAIPAGYLATFKNESEFNTVYIANTSFEYYKELFIKILEQKLGQGANDNSEYGFLYDIAIEMLKRKDCSLQDCALYLSTYIKALDDTQKATNIQDAIKVFNVVNNNNCDNNHALGKRFCSMYYFGLEYETAPEQVRAISDRIFDSIKDDWILPAYLSYVGHDRKNNPIPQKNQILNSPEHLRDFVEYENGLLSDQEIASAREKYASGAMLAPKSQLLAVLYNMCSTDYTADVIYEVLGLMEGVKKVDKNADQEDFDTAVQEVKKRIDGLVPDTANNSKQIEDARKLIREAYKLGSQKDK